MIPVPEIYAQNRKNYIYETQTVYHKKVINRKKTRKESLNGYKLVSRLLLLLSLNFDNVLSSEGTRKLKAKRNMLKLYTGITRGPVRL